MGITRISQSFASQVTPARMFNALILDSHNLFPKLLFSSIKNMEFIKGEGEVGSIKQTNFTDESLFKYAQHRIDAIDKEKYTCTYTMIAGDTLMGKLEYVTYNVKFEGYGTSGCVCKLSSEYKAKGDLEIREEDIELGKDRAIGVYEVVEAYLLAHPHAYT